MFVSAADKSAPESGKMKTSFAPVCVITVCSLSCEVLLLLLERITGLCV